MRALVLLLALAAPMLAGCGAPKHPGDGIPQVDGQEALNFVTGLVTDGQGGPRFRVPGTPSHGEAAQWLHDAMRVPGWEVAWQNFTGSEYAAMEKGQVEFYYTDPAHCKEPDRVRLQTLTFNNLWAIHHAATQSEKTLFLGAHWESKAEANNDPDASLRSSPVLGANDGASGVGLILQLMRDIPGLGLDYNVGVAFFDGEDGFEDCHPLAGSLYFVDQLEAGEVDRFLLLDMVGDEDARFIRESHSEECDPAVVDALHAAAPAHGLAANFPGTRTPPPPVSDDHVPFTEAGIPAVDLIDYGRLPREGIFGFPPYWHTTGDTLDKLSPTMLGRVGDLLVDVMVNTLSNRDGATAWPGPC